MFRSKRNGLVKRLWKSRAQLLATPATTTATQQQQRQQQQSHSNHETRSTFQNHNKISGQTTPSEHELKAAMHSLLKRLKEPQLQSLVTAVESGGGESTECVLLPRGDLQKLGPRLGAVEPHFLCCQIWRFPDLQLSCSCQGDDDSTDAAVVASNNGCHERLKSLPCCSYGSNAVAVVDPGGGGPGGSTTTSSTSPPTTPAQAPLVCCNPYHWSRVLEPDLPPPPYSSTVLEKDAENDAAPGDDAMMTSLTPVSTETGGTPPELRDTGDPGGGGTRRRWCHVAYWELRTRVGRLYSVSTPCIHVFQEIPRGDGMCLQVLQEPTKAESIRRTREKIGLGLTLSREEDGGVWVYNRARHPLFVNTPMLDTPGTRHFSVCKLLPGFCMKIFDYDLSRSNNSRTRGGHGGHRDLRSDLDLDGPFDPNSIRISFGKGWGPSYSRQFITSCPCWIEVLLNVEDR